MKWRIALIVVIMLTVTIPVSAIGPQLSREYLVQEILGPNSDILWQQIAITDHGLGYFTVTDLTGDGLEDNLHLTVLFRDVYTNRIIDVQVWQDDYYDHAECQECLQYCYENCSNLDEYLMCEQGCAECFEYMPRPTSRKCYYDRPVNFPKHIRVELRTIYRECGDGLPCYWEPDCNGYLFAYAQW